MVSCYVVLIRAAVGWNSDAGDTGFISSSPGNSPALAIVAMGWSQLLPLCGVPVRVPTIAHHSPVVPASAHIVTLTTRCHPLSTTTLLPLLGGHCHHSIIAPTWSPAVGSVEV